MAQQRQKKNRYYKNLRYRFYCRNGYLPIKHEEGKDFFGKPYQRDYAVLRLQSTRYLRQMLPNIAYDYSYEIEFLAAMNDKFPNLGSMSEEEKQEFYQRVLNGEYSWEDREIKQIVSYLLSSKFPRCKSDTIMFSLSPNRLRDSERYIMTSPNTTDAERTLIKALMKENNPFYNTASYIDIELPLDLCTVGDDGRIKYFTIAPFNKNGEEYKYMARVKVAGKIRRYELKSRNIINSLRESIGEYLRGTIKAKSGDLYYDYTRIIPIGDDRGLYVADKDGVGRLDRERLTELRCEMEEIEDPVLRDNLPFGWEGVVTDCKEWLSKKSKADLAKRLGRFDRIYLNPLSSDKFYPSALTTLSTPSMINRSYDKLNYNLFMLDSSFEFYGRGQIEIDDSGNLIFVHYEKEDSKNLYWDETPRDLRREEKYGQLVSREKSVAIIRAVDEYQGRSVDKEHMKPHEYGYKDRTVFLDSTYEDDRVTLIAAIEAMKAAIGEEDRYLIPAFSPELDKLVADYKAGLLGEEDKQRMFALMKDYYDDILEEREKEHYWYVDVSKLTEDMDMDHIDWATNSLFRELLIHDDFFVQDGTLYGEDTYRSETDRFYRPDRLYKVVDEATLKIVKDTIYRKHMLHAEGKYPLKSELNPPTPTKKKKS